MKQKVISSFFFVTVIAAQWSTDAAAPQSLGSGINAQVVATSDGGVYVAWLSDGNNYHVYLQRLNSLGEPQLGDNGMVVSDNANASWIAVFHLNLAVDSEDNAIITIVDQRTGSQWEVYTYKIAPDGSMLWGDDGVALTAASTSNMSPRLTVLPDNSVVVTWTHNDNTVLFQRISSAGVLLWGTGILISDNNANLLSPQPIVTGEGDVLIQWIRQTGPFWAANSELYLQQYDYDGNPHWSNPIVAAGPVVFPMGNWSQQSVADADSGSFSAWTEMSGSVQNAVVQHIAGDGTLSWIGGVELSTNSSNFRMSPQLTVADGTQELMVVWREANSSQSQRGVYAQRLDSSGNRLWGSNGTAVVGLNNNYDYLDLSVAGFGDDMIAAYIEQSVNMNGDIYAARLDVNGNDVWVGGAATVTNSGSPKSDMMIGKGPGCLFIAWTENDSVYIHCLLEDGTLGAPDVGGVLLVPSEYPTIQAAIDSANDGDTVLVAAGTYVGNINYNGKNIVVGSLYLTTQDTSYISSTIINGDSSGSIVVFESFEDSTAVLNGFTFQDIIFNSEDGPQTIINIDESSPKIINNRFDNFYLFQGVESAVIYCENSNSLIMNNVFTNGSLGNGYVLGGYILSKNSNLTIKNNRIENGYVGFAEPSGYIVSVNSENIIESNIIINPSMGYCDTCAVISILDGSDCIIRNNFIFQAYGDGYGAVVASESQYVSHNNTFVSNSVGYANLSSDGIVSNDIIYGSSNTVYLDESSTIQVSFSDIEGGWEGEGNIDADPLFCNPDSGDYTLAENSPCLGTGQDGANMGAFRVGCGPIQIGPVWYVATTGSDSTGDGSEANPFATILTAIDSSSDGDTVLVAAGTYVENIDFNGKNIVVQGEDRESTIIDGNQNGSVVTFESGEDTTAVLSGFTITNGLASKGGGINCFESSPTIYDLIVIYNTALEYGGGVHFYGSSLNNPSLYNSQIIGNNSNGEWWSDGGGIYCLDASVSIFNIEIIDNYATDKGGGIYFNSNNDNLSIQTLTNSIVVQNTSTYGAGIGGYCTNMNISNCTISDNNGEGVFYDGGCVYSYNPNIINTIIWNDPSIISSDSVGTFSVTYSDIKGGWAGTGNIDANPLFCPPDSGDYTLAENSPCIGTGESGANMGAFGVGCDSIFLSIEPELIIPVEFTLHQNYPNPFNPVTTLLYDLPEQANVNIIIYDMLGRQVKSLINQSQNAGFKSVVWNATNDYGKPVSAGVYLYQIQAEGFVQTKKMVLLK